MTEIIEQNISVVVYILIPLLIVFIQSCWNKIIENNGMYLKDKKQLFARPSSPPPKTIWLPDFVVEEKPLYNENDLVKPITK